MTPAERQARRRAGLAKPVTKPRGVTKPAASLVTKPAAPVVTKPADILKPLPPGVDQTVTDLGYDMRLIRTRQQIPIDGLRVTVTHHEIRPTASPEPEPAPEPAPEEEPEPLLLTLDQAVEAIEGCLDTHLRELANLLVWEAGRTRARRLAATIMAVCDLAERMGIPDERAEDRRAAVTKPESRN